MTRNELPRAITRALVAIIGVAACTIGASSPAFASQIENTTITAVGVGPNYDSVCGFECLLISLASTPTGSSCLMDAGWHYAIDISTAKGRVLAATVLAAKSSDSEVQVVGLNTCVFNNRVERIANFVVR